MDVDAQFRARIRRHFTASAKRETTPRNSGSQVSSSNLLSEASTRKVDNANSLNEQKRLEKSLADLLHKWTGIDADSGDAKELLKRGVQGVQMLDAETTVMKQSFSAQYPENNIMACIKVKFDEYMAVERDNPILL